MLPNTFQCAGQHPQQRIIYPKMSKVLRLRNPGLKKGLSFSLQARISLLATQKSNKKDTLMPVMF